MQLLDTTIVTVAIPNIQNDLGASFGEVQLVLAGYSLSFACVLITAGRLGDTRGRKKLFLIGMAGFTAASALCGAAPNAVTLVIARLLQGLCSGLMFPQVLSIIQVSFKQEEKPKAFGMYGASIGLATILGPVLGGALIQLNIAGADWRSIFYVNVPIGLVALAVGAKQLRESTAEDVRRVDLTGASLATIGLFLLVLPLVIGRDQGWPLWSWAMLAASAPVLAAFAVYEHRYTRRDPSAPLLPTRLFRDRSFSVGLVLSLVFFAGVPSFFFIFMLALQVGFGYSAIGAGVVTLIFAFTVAVASARSAAVARKLGTYVLAVGCVLLLLGMTGVILTFHAVGTHLHGWQLIPSLFVGGAGSGLFLAPVANIILAGINKGDAGSASGVLATMQQVGAAIGIAVIGVLFFGFLGSNADNSSATAVPGLRQQLAAAHVPGQQVNGIVTGFTTCFHDKANEKDPQATPASCAAIQRKVAQSPAPEKVKKQVQAAVLQKALPAARSDDFNHALRQSLFWQLGVFAMSFVLVLALPKVKPENAGPGVAA
jgi:EmrB/QacA subfamily drug resistance transporter